MTDPGNGADKRSSPRILNPCLVYLLNLSSGEGTAHPTAILHDISLSGLSFLTELSLGVGRPLEIEIRLPGRAFAASAAVVRSESFQGMNLVAAVFDSLDEPQKGELAELIRYGIF